MNALDTFKPAKADVKPEYILIGPGGGAYSNIITLDEAERTAGKIVRGKVAQFAGTDEIMIMKCTPVALVQDAAVSKTEITRYDHEDYGADVAQAPPRTVADIRQLPDNTEPCDNCLATGFIYGVPCKVCSGKGWEYKGK